MRELQGTHRGHGLRIAIVVSRFNEFITRKLLEGCCQTLLSSGVDEDDITVAWVPGSYEIPLVAREMARSGDYDAVIALGCVIRGDTPHYEFVARGAERGISQAALETGVPVVFGVLTTDTMEQAVDRAGGKLGNRGVTYAQTALEMATLLEHLRPGS